MKGLGNHVLRVVATLGCAMGSGVAAGELPANAEIRSLAASCAACHGTDGHAVAGPSLLKLAGMPKAEFLREMRAFREGTREATVMQQIARGYDDAQTDALGDFFASRH